MRNFLLISLLLALTGCSTTAHHQSAPAAASTQGVQITTLPDRLRVEINGELFTEYYFSNVPRPYCYPVIGPGHAPMTRNWPMKNTPDEEHDHPHHRSLWYAHGAVNGIDFWSEAKGYGKIVHDRFTQIRSGKNSGVIQSHNNWIAPDGTLVCSDDRTLRFYNPGDRSERVLDFDITLHAGTNEVTFGDTKEGSMAMRLAETMRLKGKVGHGHIINSAGERDDTTWGRRADWCDYSGPVEGHTVGVAIFDHPKNPRHPTWWHVRDYGLFAANPFGRHDFEHLKDKHAGDFKLLPGQSVTFRYRFYFHEGDDQQGHVAERYQQYVGGK